MRRSRGNPGRGNAAQSPGWRRTTRPHGARDDECIQPIWAGLNMAASRRRTVDRPVRFSRSHFPLDEAPAFEPGEKSKRRLPAAFAHRRKYLLEPEHAIARLEQADPIGTHLDQPFTVRTENVVRGIARYGRGVVLPNTLPDLVQIESESARHESGPAPWDQ